MGLNNKLRILTSHHHKLMWDENLLLNLCLYSWIFNHFIIDVYFCHSKGEVFDANNANPKVRKKTGSVLNLNLWLQP